MKFGHCSGKSCWRIFWRSGTSWARTFGGVEESAGISLSRNPGFSSAGIVRIPLSSIGAQPRLIRFFR